MDNYRRTLRESGMEASNVPFFSYLCAPSPPTEPQSTAASSGLHQSISGTGGGDGSSLGLPNRLSV